MLGAFPGPVAAAETLPDTGQTKCYDADGNEINPCPASNEAFYGQDAQYTRARPYTKLDADGSVLPDSATTWYQVRDNVTGLIWEVKQNKDSTANYADPHDADNGYTWYDSDPATNGGDAGTEGDGTDTEDFIAALNAENSGFGYCGHSNWRLPTIKELAVIVDSGRSSHPYINTKYFPQTYPSYYWSSTTFAGYTLGAWHVLFSGGYVFSFNDKSSNYYVRAVRSGQSGSSGHSAISVSPVSLDFGSVDIGNSRSLNLKICNRGDVDLEITTMTIDGTDAGSFALGTNSCAGQSVAPGSHCTLPVIFSPQGSGALTAVLAINSNDPDTPALEVDLAGTGVCSFSIDPASRDFTHTGGSGSITVTAPSCCV